MRAGSTYRGARRNATRSWTAQVLRADRIARGETRAEADRRRHAKRMGFALMGAQLPMAA